MLKFYTGRAITYKNGIQIGSQNIGTTLIDETKAPKNHVDIITWENLDEYYKNHGLNLPFNYWNLKRGRVISFFNNTLFNKNTRDIKEWKENLFLEVKYEFAEVRKPLEFVLKWHDGEKAIQYLKERGIKL